MKKFFRWIGGLFKRIESPMVVAIRSLSESGCCGGLPCEDCPFENMEHPISQDLARRWLKEHGIKE